MSFHENFCHNSWSKLEGVPDPISIYTSHEFPRLTISTFDVHGPNDCTKWKVRLGNEVKSRHQSLTEAKAWVYLNRRMFQVPFFSVVINLSEKSGTSASSLYKHPSTQLAVDEAQRLSVRCPNQAFAVLNVIGVSCDGTFNPVFNPAKGA